MIAENDATDLIDDLCEQIALAIGGVAAVHEVDDDLVWGLIKNLDAIRRKALLRVGIRDPKEIRGALMRGASFKPHPAIEDFLLKLRGA